MKTLCISVIFFLCSAVGIRQSEVLVTTEMTQEVTKVTVMTVGTQNNRLLIEKAEAAENAEKQASLLILKDTYKYDEVSDRVRALQGVLGNVRVDGHYGTITRKRHLQRLEAEGLTTENVAPVKRLSSDGGYKIPDDPEQRCPEFEDKFREHGLLPVEVFSYIAYRESRCNPKAVNAKYDKYGKVISTLNKDGSIDRGLVQINSCWRSVTAKVCGTGLEGLFDVDCNLKVAKYIMDNSAGKLANWSVYRNLGD